LERPDELWRDGIFQRAHLLPQPHDRLIRRRLCADQDQTVNTARVAKRHSLCKKGASRSTDDNRFFDPDRIHERIHIGGEVIWSVAAVRFI
jgi:hypothetical protein